MDKSTEQDSGRFAEVQALQGDDGTFELVVSDSAAHPVVSQEAARRHREAQELDDAPVAAVPRWSLKRAGLVLLLIALVSGGLIFALSGSENPDAEIARAAPGSGDGFQPYAGGGAAAATGRPAQAETVDRMKAAAAEQAPTRPADPPPEPVPLRSLAQPGDDEEPSDENAWELSEAELLEEARAVERAEKAEAEQGDEAAEQQDEEPVVPEEEEVDDEVSPAMEKMRGEQRIRLRNERVRTAAPMRKPAINFNRKQILRSDETRPRLREVRGLQRGQGAQRPAPIEHNEEDWEEAEAQDDRVPEFGRD